MRLIKILLSLAVLVAIGLGVFLWRMPADFAVRHGAKYLGPISLSGVRGTLWDGHADGINAFGRDFGELEWHARKAALLDGRFIADVRIKGAEVEAAGELTRNADGSLQMRDMRFSIPAEMLASSFDGSELELLGTISGTVTQATLAMTLLSDARGDARWSSAGVISPQGEMHLADMLAEFASQPDGGIGGNVRDDGSGNLAVSGRFKVGFASFDAEATLSSRNGDEQVAQMLRQFGEPQADGSTRIAAHGQTVRLR